MRLARINQNRLQLWSYATSGDQFGLAGVIVTARTASDQPASGTRGLELQAMTTVFPGGALLAGGKGTVVGSVPAMVLLAVLLNGMNLPGIPTVYQRVAKGLLPVLALVIGPWRMAAAEARQARLTAAGAAGA